MFRNLVVLLFLISQISFAQKPEFPVSTFKIGYYGNLIVNPGLSGSYEHTFAENSKTKTKIKRNRNVVKYKFNRFSITPTLGFYTDPGSNFNAFTDVSLLYRRINRKGRTLAVGAGMGYTRSFISNVYTFSQGNITETGISSFGYAAPSFRVETGRFKTKNDKTRGWYAALSTQFLLDYNTAVLPAPAFEFGKFF